MQLFVNDLTVMDFSYLCPERGMVGESWIVDVVLSGALNDESMVLDFSKVKKSLKHLIDLYVDHKLLIPMEHPFTVKCDDANSDNVWIDFYRPNGGSIHLNCPSEAYAFVYSEQVTMASVQEYLKQVIATHLPENVDGIQLTLRAEEINSPYYHYTHGLKKHDGNCQRIAHGHRSRVDVFKNDALYVEGQEYWAQRWQDIYIGSQEDLVGLDQVALSPEGQNMDFSNHYVFAYEASQGRFELLIPKAESDIVKVDSTVECIAQFMLDEQKKREPESQFTVMAYEGVGKGAMVSG
jgi:6-pyruvoyl-tetrahydropterin synthase